jgi:protein arginine kinase activator
MRCDGCGADDPIIHLTEVEGEESHTLHLCATCAEARGVEGPSVPENFLLAGVLAQLGQEAKGVGEARARDLVAQSCPFCGLTLKDFKDSGRLGCPHCWSAFEGRLRPLLVRIQGAAHHAGKVYLPPDPSASELEKRLEGLRRKLQRAVELEDFERAAELRDRIRTLQSATP